MSKTNPANLHFTQWFQWRHWLHRVEPPQIHWNPLQSRNSILFGVAGTNTSHFKANLWLDYRCKVQRHLCSSRICKFFMFFEHLQRIHWVNAFLATLDLFKSMTSSVITGTSAIQLSVLSDRLWLTSENISKRAGKFLAFWMIDRQIPTSKLKLSSWRFRLVLLVWWILP